MSLTLLGISVLTLALAPLLYRVADAARPTLLALDGFVLTAVSGVVVVHLIPHAFGTVGPIAVLLALAGFVGPTLVERSLHRVAHKAHAATLVFACAGLVADGFVDGMALGAAADEHGHMHAEGSILALAILLHRLPLAVTLWWLLRPSMGLRAASSALAALAVATISGYALSTYAGTSLHAHWVGLVQALVAGSLLHVVLHQAPPVAGGARSHRDHAYAGIGAVIGLLLVGVLAGMYGPDRPEPGSIDFAEAFMVLALDSAPMLLIAFALIGLVQALLPPASPGWMRTGRRLGQSMRGVAFGQSLPICSCGVVPLYRALVMQGAPATAAVAFLVATPALGLDAILISVPLLGAELTVVRVVAAAAVALLAGVIVGRLADARRPAPHAAMEGPVAARGMIRERLWLGLRFGFGEIVDHVGPWLLVGLVVAALVEPMIGGRWLEALPWGLDVALLALLGMPTYVCASGATPLVAMLIHKGVSPGAGLAFLLAGPAMNFTTFGVLARMHGRSVAVAFAAVIAGAAAALGLLVNALLHDASALALHGPVREAPGLMAYASLAALALVFAMSMLRQGPRAFLGQILSPYEADESDAHDGHGHHHHEHGHHEHGPQHGPQHGHGHDRHEHAPQHEHGHEHAHDEHAHDDTQGQRELP